MLKQIFYLNESQNIARICTEEDFNNSKKFEYGGFIFDTECIYDMLVLSNIQGDLIPYGQLVFNEDNQYSYNISIRELKEHSFIFSFDYVSKAIKEDNISIGYIEVFKNKDFKIENRFRLCDGIIRIFDIDLERRQEELDALNQLALKFGLYLLNREQFEFDFLIESFYNDRIVADRKRKLKESLKK